VDPENHRVSEADLAVGRGIYETWAAGQVAPSCATRAAGGSTAWVRDANAAPMSRRGCAGAGAGWRISGSYPGRTLALTGADGATDLSAYLLRLAHETGTDEGLIRLVAHLREVSKHYWSGRFHTYDQAGLPRTNNGLEGRFREVRQRLVRTTG
jgi:hypothetical protein